MAEVYLTKRRSNKADEHVSRRSPRYRHFKLHLAPELISRKIGLSLIPDVRVSKSEINAGLVQ